MDFLPTKGTEYLLILGYLAILVPFLRLTRGRVQPQTVEASRRPHPLRVAGNEHWFDVPEGYFFHRGHGWAQPDEDGLVRVGMDDFAYGLVGRPDSILLPDAGSELSQGERGWSARVGGHSFDLLSPVDGEIVETNEAAARRPITASTDPYGEGWLMKVRPKNVRRTLSNLLPTDVARAWMDDLEHGLNRRMGLPAGATVLQDGGLPVSGFARQLGGDRWHEFAQDMLLTRESRSEIA